MHLAHVIYRLATDPSFANQLLESPTTTLEATGVELADDERASLLAVLRQSTGKSKTEFSDIKSKE